jgi:hypothetical protein
MYKRSKGFTGNCTRGYILTKRERIDTLLKNQPEWGRVRERKLHSKLKDLNQEATLQVMVSKILASRCFQIHQAATIKISMKKGFFRSF